MFAQIIDLDAPTQEWTLLANPAWPVSVGVLLLIGCGLLVAWFYQSESGEASKRLRKVLVAIRVALLLVVVLMAQGWSIHPFVIDAPDLVVLIDDSRSMSVSHVPTDSDLVDNSLTRLQQVTEHLTANDADRLRRWMSSYRVRLHTLGREPIGESESIESRARQLRQLQPDFDRSPIGAEIQRLLRMQTARSTAALVVLSDGNATDRNSLSEIGRQAKDMGIPVFVMGFNRQRLPADLALDELQVDPTCFVGEVLSLDNTATVTNLNAADFLIRLYQEGDSDPIQEERIQIETGVTRYPIRMSHRVSEPGVIAFRMQAEVTDEEVDVTNNQSSATIEVRDETLQILLVASGPSYEFRYLKTLLGRSMQDGNDGLSPFDLTSLLQDADPEYERIDRNAVSVFPGNLESLLYFDVVLLCDADLNRLRPDAIDDLSQYVSQHGRSLVVIAGPKHLPAELLGTASEHLLPFESRATTAGMTSGHGYELRLGLTALGEITPFMQLAVDAETNRDLWRQLPSIYWHSPASTPKPGVRVLAEAESADPESRTPLICLQYVGSGRTLYHAFDGSYRWRYLRGDAVFGQYWMQTLRFLGRARISSQAEVQLLANATRWQSGETVQLMAVFPNGRFAPESDRGAIVSLERVAGRRRTVELSREQSVPHRFSAEIDDLVPGQYHAWLAEPLTPDSTPTCDFELSSVNSEMRDLPMRQSQLRNLAEQSGGRFIPIDRFQQIDDMLPKGRATRIESLTPRPIWNRWGVAMIFLVLVSTEWILRKRSGML